MCLTRAFLCVPVAFSNVISEHFKHWKSPEFPKRPMLLMCWPLQGCPRAHPIRLGRRGHSINGTTFRSRMQSGQKGLRRNAVWVPRQCWVGSGHFDALQT
jgi:hypothetical protein